MICPNCKKENKENQKWCCYCGTILSVQEAPAEKPQAPAAKAAPPKREAQQVQQKREAPVKKVAERQATSQKKASKRKKSGKGIVAVIIGVLVLAAIIAACLFIIPSRNKRSDSASDVDAGVDGKRLTFHRSDAAHIVKDNDTGTSFVDNELILSFNETPDLTAVEEAVEPYGGTVVGINDYLHTYQILFDREYTYDELTEISYEIRGMLPSAKSTLNYCFVIELEGYTPNDPEWANEWNNVPSGKNWNLEAIHAPEMWEFYMAMDKTPVNVGVLDNQFFVEHEDLEFKEVFLNNFEIKKEYRSPNHGNSVAGIIAATFNNGKGIAGIAPDVNLYGASMFGLSNRSANTSTDNITICEYEAGLAYLIKNKNCRVINLSYGGGIFDDHSISEADIPVAEHIEESLLFMINEGYDFLIVKGAGNDRKDYNDYDAFSLFKNQKVLDRIITVAAITNSYNNKYYLADYSNYGYSVDIAAPGERINTASAAKAAWWYNSIYTEGFNGTSAATPHVAGVAAAILSVYPNLTGPELKNILISSASGIYGYEGLTITPSNDQTIVSLEPSYNESDVPFYFYPMLDAYEAIKLASEVAQGKNASQVANEKWSEAYEAYKEYVLNQTPDWKDDPSLVNGQTFTLDGLKYYKDQYSEPKYALYDIDVNGIPELIIFNGCPFMAEAQDYVFTYENGQVKYLGNIGFRGCNLYFFDGTEYCGLFCSDGNGGYFLTNYYYIHNGTTVSEHVKDYIFDETGNVVNTQVTSNNDLYIQSISDGSTPLHFYSLEEIRAMGWPSFTQTAQPITTDSAPKETGTDNQESSQTLNAESSQGTTVPITDDKQYEFNIFLSNLSEQSAFEKNGYNGYNWNHEELVNFAFTWCKINRYRALGSTEDGGHYFFTLSLDNVNEVLKRFFNITLYDQDMRREHLADPYTYSAYNFYRDGYFYYPAASGEMHYNKFSVVSRIEQIDSGLFNIYFDTFYLNPDEYRLNDSSVPNYFYKMSSGDALSDPDLTKLSSGKATIREYEESGSLKYYITEYKIPFEDKGKLQDSPEHVIEYSGHSTQFGPEELSIVSTSENNRNLSVLCAMLSDASYSDGGRALANIYREMFDGSYCDLKFDYADGTFCSAIALGEMVINGEITNILVITVRGTKAKTDILSLDVDLSEIFADLSLSKTKYKDYQAFSSIVEFERKVSSQVSELIGNNLEKMDLDRPLKVLITGHSLGGATANLIGAAYTDGIATGNGWWSEVAKKKDIYCYTFGAINAIDSAIDKSIEFPIASGYENIHNIVNRNDEMVAVSNTSRIHGLNDGKFGHNDWFNKDYRDNMYNMLENHQMYRYLEAIDQ